METVTNLVNTASEAIWGKTETDKNETKGQEPVAGHQGAGTAAEPYDKGNILPEGGSSTTHSTTDTGETTAVRSVGEAEREHLAEKHNLSLSPDSTNTTIPTSTPFPSETQPEKTAITSTGAEGLGSTSESGSGIPASTGTAGTSSGLGSTSSAIGKENTSTLSSGSTPSTSSATAGTLDDDTSSPSGKEGKMSKTERLKAKLHIGSKKQL